MLASGGLFDPTAWWALMIFDSISSDVCPAAMLRYSIIISGMVEASR